MLSTLEWPAYENFLSGPVHFYRAISSILGQKTVKSGPVKNCAATRFFVTGGAACHYN